MTTPKKITARSSLLSTAFPGTEGVDPVTIPGVDTTDERGIVSRELLRNALKVRIPSWIPEPSAPYDLVHTCQLWWESNDVIKLLDSFEVKVPPPAIPQYYEREIKLSDLRSATRVARVYYTFQINGGLSTSESVYITIDLEAPSLRLPSDVAEFVAPPGPAITEQYLVAHQPVRISFSSYDIDALNDRIAFYLFNSSQPVEKPADGGSLVDFSTDRWTATLDPAAFRKLNNGPAWLFYRVFDETGNYSAMSAGLPFVMALGLPAPSIRPPVYNDQLIKRDDARRDEGGGVFVRIDGYPGWSAAAKHEVVVYWDDRPTTRLVVSQLPFDVEIPWTVLRGPAAVLAKQSVPVRYEIYGLNPTPAPSVPVSVNVDLTIAGQDHPNAPALLNPTLARAEIVGLTGSNMLVDADRGQPVQVRVRLFETPQVGQVLSLFWNGVGPVATYTVRTADTAGNWVYFPNVPWSVVSGANTATYAVHYTTSNGVNEQRSPVTNVNVKVIPLPAPEHDHKKLINDYLNCYSEPSPVKGIVWKIAANPNIRIGDLITVKFVGFNENNWATVNTNVVFSQSLFWEATHTAAGVMKVIVDEFATAIFPLRKRGSATLIYEVWRHGEKVAESLPGKVRIDLTYPGGKYCSDKGIVAG